MQQVVSDVVATLSRWAATVWRCLASTNGRRALTISAALAVLLAFGIFRGWEPGFGQRFSSPKPDDPVDQFAQSRVGSLLFAKDDSLDCKRYLFDNRTGMLREAGKVYCGPTEDDGAAESGADRLQVIRKSFQR